MLGILAEIPDRGRPTKGEKPPAYSENKIRLTVMVWSGMSNASLRRLPETSVRWGKSQRIYRAAARDEARRPSGLTPCPNLWTRCAGSNKAGLWGKSFSNSSMHSSWARAVQRRRTKLRGGGEIAGRVAGG